MEVVGFGPTRRPIGLFGTMLKGNRTLPRTTRKTESNRLPYHYFRGCPEGQRQFDIFLAPGLSKLPNGIRAQG